jgi:hypothetical protein
MNISEIIRRQATHAGRKRNTTNQLSLIIKLMRISLALTVLLLVTLQLLFATDGKGQTVATEKVTLCLKDESLETAIKKIEQQSSFRFFYRNADVGPLAHMNLSSGNRTIVQTLGVLLQNTPLTFRQIDANILLERKDQQSHYEITGRIVNSSDKKPVTNASVFLNNATIGDVTATNGKFTLHNVKPGKYDLTVSIIGFETYSQTITVNDSNINLPDILIIPKTIALKEVTIKPVTDPNAERNYNWFKDEFLGTSELAQECKILNPEILDIDYNDSTKTLIASSNDFLKIENDALGYLVKYKLANFRIDNKDKFSQKIHYDGSSLFEEMNGTASQKRRWQKRRQEVYEGSPMHFLRSALEDRIDEEGFWLLRHARYPNPARPTDSLIEAKIKFYKKLRSEGAKAQDSLSWWTKETKLPKIIDTLMPELLHKKDIIKPTNQTGLFALGLTRQIYSLYINYNKHHFIKPTFDEHGIEHRYVNIRSISNLSSPQNKQNTLVTFNTPYAFFDKNGIIINSNGVSYSGVWGRYRVAELLPVDYEPQPATNIKENSKELNATIFAPPGPLKDNLIKLQAASDSLVHNRQVEKMYVQLDKPYYAIGDTVWFKAYLLNAAYLTATDKSDIMYIDIANDSNKVIRQYKLPVQHGLSWGNIDLDEKDFAPGTYTFRAYTNWMRNTGSDYFFSKSFYVAGSGESNWLINTRTHASMVNGVNTANVKLQFADIDKSPAGNKVLQLQVMSGNKRLYKQPGQTDQNGLMDINFKLPENSANLAIVAENDQKNKRAVIPLTLDNTDNADVQFLPEGGNLVAGLPALIGFKAIGKDGKGINISGIVTDRDQKPVASFQSLHNGMGSFYLTTREGETYTAKVMLPGGKTKEYPLPAVKNTGMVLKIKNTLEGDSIEVFVTATDNIIQSGGSYFLIGKARGIVCYAAIFNFHDGNYIKKKIAKNLFPSGITQFTIMTPGYQPLNERLVYIDHHDNLNIQLIMDKPGYQPRDSVALKIKVTDNTGKPVAGNFSLAVTDDAQMKTDSLNENLVSRMLLTSDLKGFIEDPGYYFSSINKDKCAALDNLLLTQGWVGYDWQQVLNPPAITYQPEHEVTVKGRVVNVFNKPVKGTDILLFSKSPSILMDTVTDKEGRFLFHQFPRVDTPLFVLKAVNKNGKSFNVGITVDEIKPPDFIKPAGPLTYPWYVNSDSTFLNYTRNSAAAKQQLNFLATGHVLKEVKITAKKIVKDSQNLNGPGNADIILDEKDLEAAGKKTFLQLLEENIKGFRETIEHVPSFDGGEGGWLQWYFIDYKPVIVLIDGVFLHVVYSPLFFRDFKYYLESHNAEDIKGIEVMKSDKFALKYSGRIRAKMDLFSFIEITTRSGHGPIIDNTPGMYLYKPLPLSWPKQFYKPKYAVQDTAKHLPDLRSTIDWEPNVTTDANGEAKVWFYAADKPSTYTITIEGTDMNGGLGYKTEKIVVDKLKQKAK